MAGDLVTQVNQTIEVLKAKYLRAWITYDGLQRIESFPVPEAALREAVLNAVVHKDYATAIPIQISVYPDKLMIWNPGELPADWTIEKLLGKHASIPFNPDIANVFFRTGMIESWGRGIERIMDACHEAGTPQPEVKFESTGLWVSFQFLPEHQMTDGSTSAMGDDSSRTTQETTQEKILALLRMQPTITRKVLAESIGIGPDGIKYHLEKLKAAGIIRHVGATKAGKWEVLK